MSALSLVIGALAACSGAASLLALANARRAPVERRLLPIQHGLVALACSGALALGLWRWKEQASWQPLSTHQDAFLLMDAIFAGVLLCLQIRPRLYGVSLFATPLLALLFIWALCPTVVATPFHGQQGANAWLAIHLFTVFGSLAFAAAAAVAGGMYLFVQRRLKDRANLGRALNLVSLETLEDALSRLATIGFALFAAGLGTGVVLQIHHHVGTGWFSAKVLLAVLAFLMYGLLVNVRHATAFRGRRAAWISIAGLAVMMAAYGLALSATKPTGEKPAEEPAPPAVEVRP